MQDLRELEREFALTQEIELIPRINALATRYKADMTVPKWEVMLPWIENKCSNRFVMDRFAYKICLRIDCCKEEMRQDLFKLSSEVAIHGYLVLFNIDFKKHFYIMHPALLQDRDPNKICLKAFGSTYMIGTPILEMTKEENITLFNIGHLSRENDIVYFRHKAPSCQEAVKRYLMYCAGYTEFSHLDAWDIYGVSKNNPWISKQLRELYFLEDENEPRRTSQANFLA